MKTNIKYIKFQKPKSNFYNELEDEVKTILTKSIRIKAANLIKLKLLFYVVIFVGFYALIFTNYVASNILLLFLIYTLLGLSGILLAFNASHDAVHGVLFKNATANKIAHYLIFNLQGVNATLWKTRHIHSHHLFPNVDGCDVDIDNNPLIRLSKTHKRKPMHKHQHIYALFLYALYTLHWILIKDFVYLKKERVANMTNLSYSKAFILEVILLKVLYIFYIIVIPFLLTSIPFLVLLMAFIVMHFIVAIFFVLILIISHLTMETTFPIADKNGFLPYDYHEHQLSVSLDYYPTSKLANWLFGGFNSHSAHHLFPNLTHTLYTQITPIIQKMAKKYKLPYNELSIGKAIKSHFVYLKMLGKE